MASYVDSRLGLGIVPRTEIVLLASPSFHYSFRQRWAHRLFKKPLPLKKGSFQLFLNGYKDSTEFLAGFDSIKDTWSLRDEKEFQAGFERLVILDYLIRNTDRTFSFILGGSDNWMVSYRPDADESDQASNIPFTSQTPQNNSEPQIGVLVDIDSTEVYTQNETICVVKDASNLHNETVSVNISRSSNLVPSTLPPRVQIAAIDNGLAFPIHHPNRIRSYPYSWLSLTIASHPFSLATVQQVLPLLTSTQWLTTTLSHLEKLAKLDDDFKLSQFQNQKSVFRGQVANLVEVLHNATIRCETPLSLYERPLLLIHEDAEIHSTMDHVIRIKQRMEVLARMALFTSC